MPPPPPSDFSADEHWFLQSQLRTFSGIHASVSAGRETVKEFLMFSALGEPPSKNFALKVIAAHKERLLRLLKAHSTIGE